ncbi:PREDICTED: uncharacterized protein LOC106806168 [Priapulus caudatus]|uniref:Uncharacterized protein LOC106806168 n=1 Tax=Priapulus caudatus TaxID=37621 RepID=A0ABM1DU94_PRICU|nr:PREDICTED: uncharacterized protein LOC106806168 [Priapulus caudatus]
MSSHEVKLHIYDLSRGLAKSMSMAFLGKQLDGIWHTGIVVYDKEYFYGGAGIQQCEPGTTILGAPEQVVSLGSTDLPWELFAEYLDGLSEETYRGENYSLLGQNCNNFSSEVAQFLTGDSIPSFVTDLPGEVLQTPFGAMIQPIIDSLSRPPPSAAAAQQPVTAPPAVDPAQETTPTAPMAEAVHEQSPDQEVSEISAAVAAATTNEPEAEQIGSQEEFYEPESRGAAEAAGAAATSPPQAPAPAPAPAAAAAAAPKEKRTAPPPGGRASPIGPLPVDAQYEPLYGEAEYYTDVNITQHYMAVKNGAVKVFTEEDLHTLDELHEFLSTEDCVWSVTEEHMQLVGKILHADLPPVILCELLQLLQPACMNLDIVLMLKGDKNKSFMCKLNEFEKLDKEVQTEFLKLMSNLCNCKSGVNWLLSIIDWEMGTRQTTNSQVTIRATVTGLLSGYEPLVEAASNLVLHIARFQMSYYEDIVVEMSFALLQCLNSELPEKTAFLCLSAMIGFFHMSREMPGIVMSVGVNLKPHINKSDRCAALVAKIEASLLQF